MKENIEKIVNYYLKRAIQFESLEEAIYYFEDDRPDQSMWSCLF